jgi:hypothetical protein
MLINGARDSRVSILAGPALVEMTAKRVEFLGATYVLLGD